MKGHNVPVVLIALGLPIAHAQDGMDSSAGVLHSQNHPATPAYESVFSGPPQSIDAKISWTERFMGDARFNSPQEITVKNQPLKAMSPASEAKAAYDAQGVVKRIDPLTQKVKIAHGPIESMGMPGMTMVFKVKDAAMLGDVQVGEKIGFNVSDTDEGFIVTALSRLNASPNNAASDGRGMVKSIRAGKVKLKHGPIEKYGMPGMTMMFKVKDPSMLDGLAPGTEVDFDVNSTDGGFIITRIKPAK